MADYEEVERFEGVHAATGTAVRPKRVWGPNDHWDGHRFTDEEVEKLLAGERIEFEAVSRSGSAYTASGILAEGEYKGNRFWGFTIGSGIPPKFLGHEFTADEVRDLEAGKSVHVAGLMGKKGPFSASLTYGPSERNGGKDGIIISFD